MKTLPTLPWRRLGARLLTLWFFLSSSGLAGAVPYSTDRHLPTSGLFSTHNGPGYRYLIETDPRFASMGQFLSSDYMLSRLHFDPQQIQKRLGDGFVEQKLIADQILQQTGQRFLAGFASADAEFQALMESGIALTAAQLDALGKDIVLEKGEKGTLPYKRGKRGRYPITQTDQAPCLAPKHFSDQKMT